MPYTSYLSTNTYHAAPTTDKEIASPTPIKAHMYGEVDKKNLKVYFEN